MLTDEQRALIKATAGRLAWNEVWQYDDDARATVFVLKVGQGRTTSRWHVDQLVESIRDVLGPTQEFFVEGIEDISPDTLLKMKQL